MQNFSFSLPEHMYLYLAKAISDEARLYESTIKLHTKDISVDAKNMYSILMLEPKEKSTLTLQVEGKDETMAIEYLQSLISNILPSSSITS